jgi:mannitol/fructose-specific phosphotransferase system IIA component (Ntr-type)
MVSDFWDPSTIIMNLEGRTKQDTIMEMSKSLSEIGAVSDSELLSAEILKREKLGTTAIGGGIAFPHVKTSSVKKLSIGMGIKQSGVEFDAEDSNPVEIIFLVAAPLDSHRLYLKSLTILARIAKEPDFKKAVLSAASPEEVFEVIRNYDLKIEHSNGSNGNGTAPSA